MGNVWVFANDDESAEGNAAEQMLNVADIFSSVPDIKFNKTKEWTSTL